MVIGQGWALGQSGPSQGFLCLCPLKLPQLVDFRGKLPELSTWHKVKDYIEDEERFQTRLSWPLD